MGLVMRENQSSKEAEGDEVKGGRKALRGVRGAEASRTG